MSAGRQVLVPTEAIEQIVEYDARPLPLSDPRIGGIAVVGTDLVVSLRLDEGRDEGTGKTTGALLVSTDAARNGQGVRYAVEITRVVSLVAVEAHRSDEGGRDHAWLRQGITTDGRTIPLLDVSAMLAELGVVGVRSEGGRP
ncbi:MAG TPA: hypothetical protein VM925_12355 [Labilithrix sp.]|nr:hypothetical protein [Labilithrix sp.]